MAYPSPLLSLHRASDALLGRYGPSVEATGPGVTLRGVELVEAIQPVEVEYAAIRRHAAILDRPERAVVRVGSGSGKGVGEGLEFLNRMLTQELVGRQGAGGLDEFCSTRSLWLNRKGRIDADLRIIRLADRLLIDLDVFALARFLNGEAAAGGASAAQPGGIRSFIFAEDVEFKDLTQEVHRFSLLGPAACAVLARVSEPVSGPGVVQLGAGQACEVRIGNAAVVVDRWDSIAGRAGEIGLELIVPSADASDVYQTIAPLATRRADAAGGDDAAERRPPVIRAGWHAYNIARLEAGTPIFNLDFGPNSLPHELGRETLLDRVSFKKGCYLGQEVVARMESLGHPKQRLMGVRVTDASKVSAAGVSPFLADAAEVQTGCAVLATDEPGGAGEVVGAITSASMSPMLSSATIGLAMVKWSHATDGREVFIQTGGGRARAVLRESLGFWRA